VNPVDLAGIGSVGPNSSGLGFELMLAALIVAMITLLLGRKETRETRRRR